MSNNSSPTSIELVQKLAAEVGLELSASIPIQTLPEKTMERFENWLNNGYHGEMNYLNRAYELGQDLRKWKSWAKSLLIFAVPYQRKPGGFLGGGRVASYALGSDYHNVLGRKLKRLGKRLRRHNICDQARPTVDAAPVLEREWAYLGKVGWRGKNTLLIHPDHGPMVLLCELLIDKELPEWSARTELKTTCGTCEMCINECPTSAFISPAELDARRCISYFTIENTKEPIPVEFRKKMKDWVFGCDDCSTICPFGSKNTAYEHRWDTHPAFKTTRLAQLLTINEQDFHKLFTGSPLRRAGWEGLLRNACIALGNLGIEKDALEKATSHSSPMVREHAAWGLGQF